MTLLVVILYAFASALELTGAGLLVFDIRADQRTLKGLLDARSQTSEASGFSFPGATMTGPFAAIAAQSMAKQNIMDDFTLSRLRSGYGKRWFAVSLLIAGSVAGTAASIVGTVAN